MINTETGKEIDYKNWKIFLISITFGIIAIWVMLEFIAEMLMWEGPPIIVRIILLLAGFLFIYERIIHRISEWLIKLFEGISEGKNITQAIDETIPQITKEEMNKEMEQIAKRIEKEEQKEQINLEKIKRKKKE